MQAVADQLPAAARVRSLQQALGGALAPLASGLLIVVVPTSTVTGRCCSSPSTASGASGARCLAPWWRGAPRTGRSQLGASSATARRRSCATTWCRHRYPWPPWAVSEMSAAALPHHVGLDPWLQDTVRTLARAWLLAA